MSSALLHYSIDRYLYYLNGKSALQERISSSIFSLCLNFTPSKLRILSNSTFASMFFLIDRGSEFSVAEMHSPYLEIIDGIKSVFQ